MRGLAYYTGTVFEIHEATGKERAIAGGGRYDHLIELFGGPPTPACGFAMGDVVLKLVLEDHGLLKPKAFVVLRPGMRADAALAYDAWFRLSRADYAIVIMILGIVHSDPFQKRGRNE